MNDGHDEIEPRTIDTTLPMELVATQNVGAHTAATTIASWLLLARFSDSQLKWTYTTPYLSTTRLKFQELPHEYATTPVQLPEPAYLFFFYEVGLQFWNFTSYENTVTVIGGTWNGVWTPAPFSFDTVKVGLKLDQSKIEIKSFKFNANPLNKMWPFALDGILTVTIIEVTIDPFTGLGTSPIVRFYGDIWSIDSDYKATAIPFGNFFERKFPRFLLSVSDNYTQFSAPTQISASSFLVNGTISGAVDATSQTLVVTDASGGAIASAHAQVLDFFAGGWVETGATTLFESRGILHSEPTGTNQVTLHIDRPLIKAATNQAVKMYPGYDGSINQCDTKFANRINFGGHPFIPNVNPAVKAVKVKQVQGGKKSA